MHACIHALEQRLDKYGTSLLTAAVGMGDLNHICSPLCPLQAARSHDDMSTVLCKGLGAIPAHSTAAASDQEYLQDSYVLNNHSLENDCVSCMRFTEGTCIKDIQFLQTHLAIKRRNLVLCPEMLLGGISLRSGGGRRCSGAVGRGPSPSVQRIQVLHPFR